jgi:hypothetical protein
VAAEFINVGKDRELEARIARQMGPVAETADGWPAVFFEGGYLGGVVELESFLQQHPELSRPPPSPSDSEELSNSNSNNDNGEDVDNGGGHVLHLSNGPHSADSSYSPQVETYERPLEESMDVLDMRLSVLGGEFDATQLSHYPDLAGGGLTPPPAAGAGAGASRGAESTGLTAVDEALEGLEWAGRTGWAWVAAALGSAPPAGERPAPRLRDAATPEYDVVTSNWYGRQQRRQLRITASHLERLHPMTGEVRHALPFAEIVLLTRTKVGLNVSYRGDSEREVISDFYSTLYTDQIIDSIRRRYPMVQVATEEEAGRLLLPHPVN